MPDVVIVDTSVLLNVLNVPGCNNDRGDVDRQFQEFAHAGARLLLPLAAVFETGKHIAQLSDGRQRGRYASLFCEQVRMALDGKAPWVLVPLPEGDEIGGWLDDFPECARRKVSIADPSMIELWKTRCALHPEGRVRIWSLDKHLRGYDRKP